MSGIFFGIFLYRKTKPQSIVTEIIETKYEYIPVNTDDPKYIEKTLWEIRRYCTDVYFPLHSWAHIPIDLKVYVTQTELIDIIEQLESFEYSWKSLQIQEKESINSELVNYLKK